MLKQTKGLNAINRKQFRQALLDKGTKLIDPATETIQEDITLTRPSAKIVWNGEVFVTVPANEPAWNVDFETGEKRLLVEGEAGAYIGRGPNGRDFSIYGEKVAYLEDSDVFVGEQVRVIESLPITYIDDSTAVRYSNPAGDALFVPNQALTYFLIIKGVAGYTLGIRDIWQGVHYYFEMTGEWQLIRIHTRARDDENHQVRIIFYTYGATEMPFFRLASLQVRDGHIDYSSPILHASGVPSIRAADTITSAHTPTGTQLISSDGKFDATNDVSKVLPETGSFSGYTVFDKDLTAQALTRFKSAEVFVDAP